ncbi:hypothetical protein QA802_01190 [Streptomyces sp. B21-105]
MDAHLGQVRAGFDARTDNSYDLRPLGDGSWLTTDASGHPIGWTDS